MTPARCVPRAGVMVVSVIASTHVRATPPIRLDVVATRVAPATRPVHASLASLDAGPAGTGVDPCGADALSVLALSQYIDDQHVSQRDLQRADQWHPPLLVLALAARGMGEDAHQRTWAGQRIRCIDDRLQGAFRRLLLACGQTQIQ